MADEWTRNTQSNALLNIIARFLITMSIERAGITGNDRLMVDSSELYVREFAKN